MRLGSGVFGAQLTLRLYRFSQQLNKLRTQLQVCLVFVTPLEELLHFVKIVHQALCADRTVFSCQHPKSGQKTVRSCLYIICNLQPSLWSTDSLRGAHVIEPDKPDRWK